ncbi:hypothetical protein [Brasilonema sp. UFV-L1]|uniref:hypothetical protein n=1 Tax=Brasilonema sp. UFV-L1 TaxID=2234130 RepID=UPI00145E6212|nr:hypothetical protein [Brasilonema sp. UFV-L1]NMG07860.1 hypothetical protein [Brasilonema sp. UFV-L1]
MRGRLALCFGVGMNLILTATPGLCDTPSKSAQDLDLSPEIIKNSPVLQRWQRQVPNVLEDIKNDPSFPTKVRLGYSYFSSKQAFGLNISVQDIFIGRSGLTLSGEYQAAFNGQREVYGADLHYYLRPLGSYINIAPVVGYRHLEINSDSTDGVSLGAKLLLVLSRGGAADISLTQSWIALGTGEEVGFTTISFSYALTRHLRISTEIQQQNTRQDKDTRLGMNVEWIP